MPGQFYELTHPGILKSISTNDLRDKLSLTINRAAFGMEPVLITRRGRNIAAIISIRDLEFLEAMRYRREEAIHEELPADQNRIGATLARHIEWEIFFG
jgi:prevent-host-death family protein